MPKATRGHKGISRWVEIKPGSERSRSVSSRTSDLAYNHKKNHQANDQTDRKWHKDILTLTPSAKPEKDGDGANADITTPHGITSPNLHSDGGDVGKTTSSMVGARRCGAKGNGKDRI